MIFFCLVRVACQTVSVFYFPTTEVATCSPRLPIFITLKALSNKLIKKTSVIDTIHTFIFDIFFVIVMYAN